MLTLGQIENSEYNLLGAMSEDDFLQALDLSGPNEKKKLFDKAWFKQVHEWVNIADNIALKPWKVEAALRVLHHIGAKR